MNNNIVSKVSLFNQSYTNNKQIRLAIPAKKNKELTKMQLLYTIYTP